MGASQCLFDQPPAWVSPHKLAEHASSSSSSSLRLSQELAKRLCPGGRGVQHMLDVMRRALEKAAIKEAKEAQQKADIAQHWCAPCLLSSEFCMLVSDSMWQLHVLCRWEDSDLGKALAAAAGYEFEDVTEDSDFETLEVE